MSPLNCKASAPIAIMVITVAFFKFFNFNAGLNRNLMSGIMVNVTESLKRFVLISKMDVMWPFWNSSNNISLTICLIEPKLGGGIRTNRFRVVKLIGFTMSKMAAIIIFFKRNIPPQCTFDWTVTISKMETMVAILKFFKWYILSNYNAGLNWTLAEDIGGTWKFRIAKIVPLWQPFWKSLNDFSFKIICCIKLKLGTYGNSKLPFFSVLIPKIAIILRLFKHHLLQNHMSDRAKTWRETGELNGRHGNFEMIKWFHLNI